MFQYAEAQIEGTIMEKLKKIETRFDELATKYSELADKYAAALGREAELKERIRILEAPKLGERSGPW